MTFEYVYFFLPILNSFTYSGFQSTSIFKGQSKDFFLRQWSSYSELPCHPQHLFCGEKSKLGRPNLVYQTIPAVTSSIILVNLNDNSQHKKIRHSSLGSLHASDRICYILLQSIYKSITEGRNCIYR